MYISVFIMIDEFLNNCVNLIKTTQYLFPRSSYVSPSPTQMPSNI